MQSSSAYAQSLALLAIITIVSPHRIFSQAIPAPVSEPTAVPDTTGQPQVQPPPVPQVLISKSSAADPGNGVPRNGAAREGASVMVRPVPRTRLPDFNRDIYYKNKLEFSLETGWLPNNIPFVFDFIVNSPYNTWPLHYTLVPNIASVRWELDNLWGWKFLRGNTDFSFSGAYTAIPRGAETRYFAFDYGIRRNFVPRRWRVVPYVEGRGGVGRINAKGPQGVAYAQGQDLTFTLMVGSGARYNFGPRYGVAAGMTYMHVSNFFLSEPKYWDNGINAYGAIVGVYMRLGKPKPSVVY